MRYAAIEAAWTKLSDLCLRLNVGLHLHYKHVHCSESPAHLRSSITPDTEWHRVVQITISIEVADSITQLDDSMTDTTMATRIETIRKLVPQLSTALKSFQASESKFRIIQTIDPKVNLPSSPSPLKTSPSNLVILDSSFNPPTKAHLSLCLNALKSYKEEGGNESKETLRLLLLFSTMNADKAPSAASFAQRLALMTIFATDIVTILSQSASQDSASNQSTQSQDQNLTSNQVIPSIDIGLTTEPYYTDKSLAIAADPDYAPQARHTHCIGFDTLIRFFAAKYYKTFTPPLSALAPFFDGGHSLRVTMRPNEAEGADDPYASIDTQRGFWQNLADGGMEAEGGKREWARLVEMVEPGDGVGVSSTKVRNAAKAGEWAVLSELCTKGVAEWTRVESLYDDDDRGPKIA